MKAWILALFLAVIALAPVFILSYYYRGRVAPQQEIASFKFEDETPKKLEVGAKLDVKACKVLDGSKYEMYLEGGKWIRASLTVETKEQASPFVVELLNRTTPPPPSVTLLRQSGDQWIVEFYLNVDGQRVNLVDLLRSKGLLL